MKSPSQNAYRTPETEELGRMGQDRTSHALALHWEWEDEEASVTVDGRKPARPNKSAAFSPRQVFFFLPESQRPHARAEGGRARFPTNGATKNPAPEINSNPTPAMPPRWARRTWFLVNPRCCCACCDGVGGCCCWWSGLGDDAGELRELPDGAPPGCMAGRPTGRSA